MRLHKRQATRRFWAGVCAGLLISMTGVGLWWAAPALTGAPQTAVEPRTAAAEPATKPVQVLVLGVDGRDHLLGDRSDTMMLVRITGDQVRVLSIPRDTKVDLPEHPESKINSAYTYGGTDLAKQAAGGLLGLPVDYYVKVDLDGFRHIVDMMGGVRFDVPEPMHYVDPTDDTNINLDPGPQVLDGDKAEQFVRFRHDAIGDDMGRIHRQQEFLKAAVTQALTPSNLLKLPQLVYTARSYVQTDIPAAQQLKFGQAIFKAQQNNSVVEETLPGHGGYVDGISYFLVNQDQLQQLVSVWEDPAGHP